MLFSTITLNNHTTTIYQEILFDMEQIFTFDHKYAAFIIGKFPQHPRLISNNS